MFVKQIIWMCIMNNIIKKGSYINNSYITFQLTREKITTVPLTGQKEAATGQGRTNGTENRSNISTALRQRADTYRPPC